METKVSNVVVKDPFTFNGIKDIAVTPKKYTSIGDSNNPYLQQELMDMAMDGVFAISAKTDDSPYSNSIPLKATWNKLSFNPGNYVVTYTATSGTYTKQAQRTIHMYSESNRPKIKLSSRFVIIPYLAENFDIRDYIQVTGTDKVEGDISKSISTLNTGSYF